MRVAVRLCGAIWFYACDEAVMRREAVLGVWRCDYAARFGFMRVAARLCGVGRCYAWGGAVMRRDLVLCVRRSGYAA